MRSQTVIDRLYRNFLLPSRLDDLGRLLETALQDGYDIHPLGEFWRLSEKGKQRPPGKHLLLRHDIDTGLATARDIWKLERSLGVQGSFFFRLSTVEPGFMREIASAGGEVGYHYEELATVSKQRGLRSSDGLPAIMAEIALLFVAHLESLREKTGLPLTVAAAHGDWFNRRLGVSNEVILHDARLRERARIELEAYDGQLTALIDTRISDQGAVLWTPEEPGPSIENGTPVVQLLLHPREWRADMRANLAEDARRAFEGLRFRLNV